LKASDHLQEVSLGHARDLESLKRDLEKLEMANKNLGYQLTQTKDELQEALDSKSLLKEKCDMLQTANNSLEIQVQSSTNELRTTQDQFNAMKKRFEVLENTVKVYYLDHIKKFFF
jgi:chromosome segregation ATPase